MNASQDRLHAGLADLAEDVTVVDLHERALRASRALSRRRAVTSVAVVAAVVAMGTGAAFAVLPQDRSTLVVATAPPSTASVSPATTPSPPVSGTPSDRASAAPSAQSGPTVPSLGALPGALFYADLATAGKSKLWKWSGASKPSPLGAEISQPDARASLTVSPDGTRIAWIQQPASGVTTLYTASTDGSHRRALRTNVDPYCAEPTWSPDSRRVLTLPDTPDAGLGTVDVTTGAYQALTPRLSGCHPTWSAGGSKIAYTDGSGSLFLADSRGGHQRKIPGIGADTRYCDDPGSLSPTGNHLAVYLPPPGGPAGDIARSLTTNTVLDTRTGKAITLPVKGKMIQARYLANGDLLIRTAGTTHNTLTVVSPQGTVRGHLDEPATLSTATLLQAT